MTRIALLASAAILLFACSTASATDAQVLSDAAGLVTGVANVAAQINLAKPGTVSPTILAELTAAQNLVTTISATTPAQTGAGTLVTIDNDIADALNAIAPIAAAVYPAAGPIISAAQVILPIVEAYANPLITKATGVSATAPVSAADLASARKALGIVVVK